MSRLSVASQVKNLHVVALCGATDWLQAWLVGSAGLLQAVPGSRNGAWAGERNIEPRCQPAVSCQRANIWLADRLGGEGPGAGQHRRQVGVEHPRSKKPADMHVSQEGNFRKRRPPRRIQLYLLLMVEKALP